MSHGLFRFNTKEHSQSMTTHHMLTFLLSVVGATAVLVVIYERKRQRGLRAILRRVLQRRSGDDSKRID